MNPEVKEKWIAALRSGEYTQCTGRLRRKEVGFCCLGVLTDIHIKENNGVWVEEGFFQLNPSLTGEIMENGGLSNIVKTWAGLDSPNPAFYNIDTEQEHGNKCNKWYSAVDANDTDRKSFLEIADLVEKYL